MKRLVLLGGLILTATCSAADDKKDVPKELQPFQGSWKVVKAEAGGIAPPDGIPAEFRFIFSGDKLTIKEGKDNPKAGTYAVNPKKDPAEIDLIPSEDKDKKALGIYKFEKDGKLTLSFVKGANVTRPKKFGDPTAVVLVLEKVKE